MSEISETRNFLEGKSIVVTSGLFVFVNETQSEGSNMEWRGRGEGMVGFVNCSYFGPVPKIRLNSKNFNQSVTF